MELNLADPKEECFRPSEADRKSKTATQNRCPKKKPKIAEAGFQCSRELLGRRSYRKNNAPMGNLREFTQTHCSLNRSVTANWYQSVWTLGATWPRRGVSSAKERKVRTSGRECQGCNLQRGTVRPLRPGGSPNTNKPSKKTKRSGPHTYFRPCQKKEATHNRNP